MTWHSAGGLATRGRLPAGLEGPRWPAALPGSCPKQVQEVAEHEAYFSSGNRDSCSLKQAKCVRGCLQLNFARSVLEGTASQVRVSSVRGRLGFRALSACCKECCQSAPTSMLRNACSLVLHFECSVECSSSCVQHKSFAATNQCYIQMTHTSCHTHRQAIHGNPGDVCWQPAALHCAWNHATGRCASRCPQLHA